MINDKGSGESSAGEKRRESVDVMHLIVVCVSLGNRIWGSSLEGVVVGNVCGKTADTVGLDGAVEIAEECGSRCNGGSDGQAGWTKLQRQTLEIRGPSEPPSMTSIEVEPDIALLKFREHVLHAGHVRGLSILAVRVGQVGNQVGQ